MIPPLLTTCRECSGAGLRTLDHPNDPWAKTWTCRECEGTGEVVAECECCSRDAVTVFEGLMLCATCAREQMEDAVETAEYRAETVR
jgi:DnaJ-class molecular chaperone